MRNAPIQVPLEKPIPRDVFLGIQKNGRGLAAELLWDQGRIRLRTDDGTMADVLVNEEIIGPGEIVRNENGVVFILGKNENGEGGPIRNEEICLPARWIAARVATGKLGSARWATRGIIHIVFEEELRDGPLQRDVGSYLCNLSPLGATEHVIQDVTCPKCLKRASRYIKDRNL